MQRLIRSLLAATLFAAPVISGATLASAAVALAQTADGESQAPLPVCPAWYGAHTACVAATAGEPARAAPPAVGTLESDGTAEAAGPPEDGPAFAPIEATPATSSDEPYYGPGWGGPVNQGPLPICPAWYGAHTSCAPATGPGER